MPCIKSEGPIPVPLLVLVFCLAIAGFHWGIPAFFRVARWVGEFICRAFL